MGTGPHRSVGRSLAAEAFSRNLFRLGSSFRFGRSRGAFCHSGWCQQCKVELQDGQVGLACQLPADQIGKLKYRRLVRLPFSLLARVLRPWFHERIVLWPSILQKLFLGMVRRASGALPINSIVEIPKRSEKAACEVLVVGGGQAGSAAHAELVDMGVDVAIVDEKRPSADTGDGKSQFSCATVLGIYRSPDGGPSALCALPDGTLQIAFRRLVVATGGYDRLLPIPGNDLPGIVGLEGFERLVDAGAVPAGCTIGLYAPARGAVRALAIAEKGRLEFAWASGSHDIPDAAARLVLKNSTLASAIGIDRLRAVEFGDGSQLGCDILVVGFRQPKYELQIQAGQTAMLAEPGAGVAVAGRSDFPMIAVGEAGGATADIAASTRSTVRAWYRGNPAPENCDRPTPMPGCADIPDDTIVCPCEDVKAADIRMAVAGGFDSIEHLKRRTGAATGPCQGKLCHALLLDCLAAAGVQPALPTMRPLVRPVQLARFARASDG